MYHQYVQPVVISCDWDVTSTETHVPWPNHYMIDQRNNGMEMQETTPHVVINWGQDIIDYVKESNMCAIVTLAVE